MLLTAAQWNLRVENYYKAMCAFPICSLFSWKIAPGEKAPRVKSYLVTYNVKTMVMDNGRLKPQEKTTVRIDLSDSPNTAPSVYVVEGKVPYHPNWYPHGKLCPGDMWAKEPILWKYVINIGKVLAFDPDNTRPSSPANSEAAIDWNVKQSRPRKPYPCGNTNFPHPVGY